MAKEWKKTLADIQEPRDPRADGLGLGDYVARYAGLVVPDGFPGSFTMTDTRMKLVNDLAAQLEQTEGAPYLAKLAAGAIEELMIWKSAFALYARDKDIELCEAKAELYRRLYDAKAEFLGMLSDPGTRAYLNAMAKQARDPKQIAKAAAFGLWTDWQSGKTRHKSGAAFHRYVCDQLPDITSTKTVERWCKEWHEASKKKGLS